MKSFGEIHKEFQETELGKQIKELIEWADQLNPVLYSNLPLVLNDLFYDAEKKIYELIEEQHTTPYIKIAVHIRKMIQDGIYKSGDRLPSYAAIAQEHDVAINTVKTAVAKLNDQGYTISIHGKGTFVK